MRAYRLKDEKMLRSLFISVALFLVAASIKALLLFLSAREWAHPGILSFGGKLTVFLTTGGVVFLLRWLIADAPLNLLRRYTVTPLLRTIITLLLYFAAFMYLLHKLFGINMLPLLTTSAVLTGILALSLQETLKNLFTGLWINTERIVAKGDWVRVADKEGQVMEVTWRTTRLLTRGDDHIILPNRMLAENVLENLTYPTPLHMVELDISASYKDAPNKVREVLAGLAASCRHVKADPAPEILLLGYGDYAVNYRVRVWIDEYLKDMTVRSDIYRRAWYAFRRHSIEIPYPIRAILRKHEPMPVDAGVVAASLREIDFLKVLRDEDLDIVARSARAETFGEGEPIVVQGEPGDTCYFIRSGMADVMLKGPSGEEGFIASLKAGDFFGEMSLLAGEPRSATVVAMEDTVCVVIGSEAFGAIFSDNPAIAEKLSEVLAVRTAELEAVRSKTVSRTESQKHIQKTIMSKIKRFFKIS